MDARRYATLLPVAGKIAGMELDRDIVLQVTLSVVAVALFVAGLVVLSGAYGADVNVTNDPLEGTIDGEFQGNITEGESTIEFDGTFDNDIEASLEGTITGDFSNESFSGTFEGDISGPIEGTANGTVRNGTIDEESGTLEAEFQGNTTGTTAMDLTETGGVALIALMIAFIFAMPGFGLLIKRLGTDDE